VFIGLFPLAGR